MGWRHLLGVLILVATVAAGCGGSSGTPEALVTGRTVYGDRCSMCHGDSGQGGVGPALDAVAENWPSCVDQIEWVALGSDGWAEARGSTYGAAAIPVAGGMPANRDLLTAEEIAAVSAFVRVTFAGADGNSTLADCGLAGPG